MEQKIIPIKIYEDETYIAFKYPISNGIKIYLKQEDDFHNVFTKVISDLTEKPGYSDSHEERLLYKLLKGEK